MSSDRFSLPFLTRVLVAAAERRRPALRPTDPGYREALRDVFVQELAQIRPGYLEIHHDAEAWDRLQTLLLGDALDRYVTAAKRRSQLEERRFELWRGGDLVARAAYGLGGLAFGLFLVYAPFIPIPRTWDLLILALMLGAPFLPDLQVSMHDRRYAAELEAIVRDMESAEASRRIYAPLGLSELDGPAAGVGAEAEVEGGGNRPPERERTR